MQLRKYLRLLLQKKKYLRLLLECVDGVRKQMIRTTCLYNFLLKRNLALFMHIQIDLYFKTKGVARRSHPLRFLKWYCGSI